MTFESFILGVVIGGAAVNFLNRFEIRQLERNLIMKEGLIAHYKKMTNWLIERCAREE